MTVVVCVVVLGALFLPYAPAGAIGGVPTVTVDPNTGLADGQPVSLDVTDFPPNQLIGVVECPATATNQQECAHMTPVTTTTDASGAASLTYSVTRVIFTNVLGRVDCAQTACVIGVGTAFGPFVSATARSGSSIRNCHLRRFRSRSKGRTSSTRAPRQSVHGSRAIATPRSSSPRK